jgi:hypothetical protein
MISLLVILYIFLTNNDPLYTQHSKRGHFVNGDFLENVTFLLLPPSQFINKKKYFTLIKKTKS